MPQWRELGERLRGKWQIPLLGVSLVLLGGAFFRLLPRRPIMPVEESVKHIDRLIANGFFERAIELAGALSGQEGRSEDELAALDLRLARAKHGNASHKPLRSAELGSQVIEHYRGASSRGVELAGGDLIRLGNAFEWAGRLVPAIDNYEKAINAGVEERYDLRRRVIEMWEGAGETPSEEIDALVDELLSELGEKRPDLRLWALEKKLALHEELGLLAPAGELVSSNSGHFEGTELEGRFQYLQALVLYKSGRFDQAEAHLRAVRNGMDTADPAYGMTGWLLGKTVLGDGGPQRPLEAISFFQDVLAHDAGSPYALASRIGYAEALSMLYRHDEAVENYRVAIDELEEVQSDGVFSRGALRLHLSVLAGGRLQEGDLTGALGYARLSASLIDPARTEEATLILQQLGDILALRAEDLLRGSLWSGGGERSGAAEGGKAPGGGRDAQGSSSVSARMEGRKAAAEAGAVFLELARQTPDERRASESSWRAAELFAEAGGLERSARLYSTFVTERPDHPLVGRALFRVGQIYQRMGRLEEAVDAYQQCYRLSPQSLDGSRALVPLARCYLLLGGEHEELAEKTLRIVLEDSEVFTPDAPEFAEAEMLLGDTLNRRGAFEEAIAVLEEALARYPGDPRTPRVRYLLAESYRRSALSMKDEPKETELGGELARMEQGVTDRFLKAAALYREIRTALETRPDAELSPPELMYLRHAYLYEADCHFELRDYSRALLLYEDAASTWKDSPSGLGAYVQIINCHVFLGEPKEARAALARARILADAIPEEAFISAVSPEGREGWKRYLNWLGESGIF